MFKPILRSLNRFLPPKGREFSRIAYAGVKSLVDIPLKNRLFGDKADLVPPLYLMRDGNRDYREFKQNGSVWFSRFLSFGLKPADRVLDIGCGIGRKTIPLLDFLKTGSYEGIDPVQGQVQWCSERITPRYPNFRFHRVDLWSKYYNPTGKIAPSEYVFPFGDGEFDFVILSSVFTHMFSADVLHYISETSRLLKPGGGGLVSFFLLNRESEALIEGRKSTVNLVFETEDGSRADNADRLETAVGHQEAFVMEAFQRRGLTMEVNYGSWCGRAIERGKANGCPYQDFARLTRT
jgi:SAM-dependent methyltransferase